MWKKRTKLLNPNLLDISTWLIVQLFSVLASSLFWKKSWISVIFPRKTALIEDGLHGLIFRNRVSPFSPRIFISNVYFKFYIKKKVQYKIWKKYNIYFIKNFNEKNSPANSYLMFYRNYILKLYHINYININIYII